MPRRARDAHLFHDPLFLDAAFRHLVSALHNSTTNGSVLGEQLPATLWPLLPSATTDSISQRIRDAFDPRRILNRGIFGEHTA